MIFHEHKPNTSVLSPFPKESSPLPFHHTPNPIVWINSSIILPLNLCCYLTVYLKSQKQF